MANNKENNADLRRRYDPKKAGEKYNLKYFLKEEFSNGLFNLKQFPTCWRAKKKGTKAKGMVMKNVYVLSKPNAQQIIVNNKKLISQIDIPENALG